MVTVRFGRMKLPEPPPTWAVGDRAWPAFVRGVKQGEFGV
jgi:hypothetical protein